MLTKRFAERLKQARRERKVSQQDLAVQLGFKYSQIVCAWENAKRTPGLDVIDVIAEKLKVRPEFFFVDNARVEDYVATDQVTLMHRPSLHKSVAGIGSTRGLRRAS